MSAIPIPAPAASAAGAGSRGCPECGDQLDHHGPFDGRVNAGGPSGGHEGFGDTFMCASGHWYAGIQGALVPPHRILTVLEA